MEETKKEPIRQAFGMPMVVKSTSHKLRYLLLIALSWTDDRFGSSSMLPFMVISHTWVSLTSWCTCESYVICMTLAISIHVLLWRAVGSLQFGYISHYCDGAKDGRGNEAEMYVEQQRSIPIRHPLFRIVGVPRHLNLTIWISVIRTKATNDHAQVEPGDSRLWGSMHDVWKRRKPAIRQTQ